MKNKQEEKNVTVERLSNLRNIISFKVPNNITKDETNHYMMGIVMGIKLSASL